MKAKCFTADIKLRVINYFSKAIFQSLLVGCLCLVGMQTDLCSQNIPVRESLFFDKLPAPYSDIIKATKTWEESDEKEADLDSIRAFFDQKLAEPALLDR
ncbi:MAG: hypothetical protein AAFP08_09355, partial [Bacteroidota bacterium]